MVDLCYRVLCRNSILLTAFSLTALPAFADDIFRLGSVQQLNLASATEEYRPRVACAASGTFVATWMNADADGWGVAARTFDSGGAPTSGEIRVNAVTTDSQDASGVARDAAGNFVVVWRDLTAEGAVNGTGIRARLFTAAGVGATEFSVNSHLPGNQGIPDIARSAGGSFVVVWFGIGPGGVDGVWLRRFDAGGTPQGVETLVAAGGGYPSVVLNPVTGGFVVAWESSNGTDLDIHARRFDAFGNPLGSVLDVNGSTAGNQQSASLATDADGDFVVLFEGPRSGDSYGVSGQLYSAVGAPVGEEFSVNAETDDFQLQAVATFDATGGFLVTWAHLILSEEARLHAAYFSPLAVRYDPANDYPLTSTLETDHSQFGADLCSDGERSFRAVFHEYGAGGTNSEIYSQRLFVGIFADGFESNDTTAWSP